MNIPTEYQDHVAFVKYLRSRNIDHWHTPNETYTKSMKQKSMNTAKGVQSGIPDLFLILDDKVHAIELKRAKGGVVSDNQRKWLNKLNSAGIKCAVCHGIDEAIQYVEEEIGEYKIEF